MPRCAVVQAVKERLLERKGKYPQTSKKQSASELEAEIVSAHPVTLVQLSEDFKARLKQEYLDDPR